MSKAFSKLTQKKEGRKSALIKAAEKKKTGEWKPFDWQQEVLDKGEGKNVVICAGRQVGKTELAIHIAFNLAERKDNSTVWWVSPTLRQCRRDIFPRILRQFRGRYEEATATDLTVYLPNGSRLIMLSGEPQHLDNLLGATLDGVVLDEAARLHRKVWEQYVEPMLMVKDAKVWMISTPLGKNWFWEAWRWGQKEDMEEWVSFHTPSTESPMITDDKLQIIRERTPRNIFEQEYLAKFLDSSGGAFYGIEQCIDEYDIPQPFNEKYTYTMGVDLARKNDFTVITVIDQDNKVVYIDRCRDVTFEQQKSRINYALNLYGGKMPIYLDATGMGASVEEQLRFAGLRIVGITLDYRTKAKIIQNLAFQIESGEVKFPIGNVLIEELSNYQYEKTSSGNPKYQAASGYNDDTVISLALAVWGNKYMKGEGIWVL
jgi:phage FluMu gp28-like protein